MINLLGLKTQRINEGAREKVKLNYLICLSFWGLVSAVCFLVVTPGEAQVILEKNQSKSDRQGDLENTFTLPGYFRTDAALFYKRDNWRAQLNIENLFDIEYFSSTNFDSRLGVNPGAPFTILGTISVEF